MRRILAQINLKNILNRFKDTRPRLYAIALFVRLLLLGWFGDFWDSYVFIRIARDWYLNGLTPYDVATLDPPWIYIPVYPFTQNWYAYPPLSFIFIVLTYGLYLLLGLKNPFWERFFVKLPMALGDLFLAYSIYKFLLTKVGEKKAAVAERFILFNPFIIFISSIWGMFDSLSIAFMVYSLHLLEKEEIHRSAFFYALSVLSKQTTAFAFVFVIIYLLKKGKRKAFDFFISLALTGFLFIAPFVIRNINGLINQVITMHLSRPIQGFSLVSLAMIFLRYGLFYMFFLTSPDVFLRPDFLLVYDGIVGAVSIFLGSFSTILLVILVLTLAADLYMVKEADFVSRKLILSLSIFYIFFVLFNKVSNEQYYLYTIIFLIIYMFSDNSEAVSKLSTLWKLSIVLTVMSSIYNYRLVLFIPYDTLESFGENNVLYFYYNISSIGLNLDPVKQIVTIVAFVSIFIVDLYLLKILTKLVKSSKTKASPSESPELLVYLYRFLRKLDFKSLILISLTLAGMITVVHSKNVLNDEGSVVSVNNFRAIFYSWQYNPSHDPSIRAGFWMYSQLTPSEGYYDSNMKYLEEDLKQIREIGLNTIVFDYNLFNTQSMFIIEALSEETYKMGMHWAIGLDFYSMLRYLELTTRMTKNEISALMFDKISSWDAIYQVYRAFLKKSYLNINDSVILFLRNIEILSSNVSQVLKFVEKFIKAFDESYKKIIYVIILNSTKTLKLFDELSGLEKQRIILSIAPTYVSNPDDYINFVKNVSVYAVERNMKFIPSIVSRYMDNADKTKQFLESIMNKTVKDFGKGNIVVLSWNNYLEDEVIEPTIQLKTSLYDVIKQFLIGN